MTRKDYIVIAGALRQALTYHAGNEEAQIGVISASHSLAEALRDNNPRFDKAHFFAVVRGEKELLSRPSRNGRQS